jgi:1-deoxy-D-xylulose-5-phosphate reductoisomerase
MPAGALASVTPAAALQHPTWRMGRKITIDSATLMNKGLEVIEAHWLFDLPASRIDVVIHPQSIVHSMVELVDGSIIAQLGGADMRLPIQYACSYPDRWEAPVARLNLLATMPLEFQKPDVERFPCLALAYRALEAGPSHAVVLNAANEVAVASYLEEKISFQAIPRVIDQSMDAHTGSPVGTLDEVRELDRWARHYSQNLVRGLELQI